MNKNIIMVIILFLVTYSSFARLYFPNLLKYQTYTEGVAGQIYTMVPFQKTGYLMAGRANTNDFLIKTDLNGNKEWEYFSDDQSYSVNTAATVSKSGKCMLIGSKRVCTMQGVCYSTMRLSAVSRSGDLLWEKNYDNGARDAPVSLCEMDDGGFMIAGNSTTLDNYFMNDIVILRTDSTGNLLWKKKYGTLDGSEVVFSAEKTSDNGLMVLAHKTMENRTWLLRLNASGDTLWTKTLYYKSGNRLLSIKRTSDSSYICAGMSESLYSKSEFWILKLDNEGNSLWTKSYSRTDKDTAKSIDTLSEGGYCFTGNSGPRCVLMKIGSTGDSLWSLDYGYFTPIMPVSLIITPSGQFVLGGNTGPSSTLNDVFFLSFQSENRSTTYPEFANWEVIDTLNSALPAEYISRIAIDSTNRVWLVIWDESERKYHLVNQSDTTWKSLDILPRQQIMEMTATTSGHMWFAGDNGIYHYNGNTVSNTPVSLQAFDVAPINNTEAYVGGTYGLYKLTGGTLTKLASVADTAGIQNVNHVMVDEKGNVWYSSIVGVAVQNSVNTVVYNHTNSLITGGVRDMKSIAGNVWVSTSEGLIKKSGDIWTVFDSTNTILPTNGITAFAVDARGNPLAGCSKGFAILNEGILYTYSNSPLPSNIINSIDVDKKGNVLIGTSQGLVIIHNSGSRIVHPIMSTNMHSDKTARVIHILKSSKNTLNSSNSSYYNLSGKLIGKNANSTKSTNAASGVLIRKSGKF